MASSNGSRAGKLTWSAPAWGVALKVRDWVWLRIVSATGAGGMAASLRSTRTVRDAGSQRSVSRPAAKRATDCPPSGLQRQSPGVAGTSCQLVGAAGAGSGAERGAAVVAGVVLGGEGITR